MNVIWNEKRNKNTIENILKFSLIDIWNIMNIRILKLIKMIRQYLLEVQQKSMEKKENIRSLLA